MNNNKSHSYKSYTQYNQRAYSDNHLNKSFASRLLICILIFIFCVSIKFYPNNYFEKTKKSIEFILSYNTDLKENIKKFKSNFAKKESFETLNPVSNMTAPSSGKIVKGFGIQDASGSGFHYGIDILTENNENIVAANDGKVIEIATNTEYGTYIIIRHSEEITTLYGNLNEILTNVGDTVSKGQPIAYVSNKGTYYFELCRNDTYLDPTEFIKFPE